MNEMAQVAVEGQTLKFYFILAIMHLGQARADVCDIVNNHVRKAYQSMVDGMLSGQAKLYGDLGKRTSYFYHGRTVHLINSLGPEQFGEIFGVLKPEEIDALFWAVKSGNMKVTPDEEMLIEEIYHMVKDDPGIFWRSSDPAVAKYEAVAALNAQDAANNVALGSEITANLTSRGLERAENTFFTRAISELTTGAKYANTRWYDGMRRWFWHYYPQMQTIIDGTQNFRKQLQFLAIQDRPPENLIRLKEVFGFTEEEMALLKTKVSDTGPQVQQLRERMAAVVGDELATNTVVDINQVDIYQVAGKMAKEDFSNSMAQKVVDSSDELDEIEAVMQTAWKRKHPEQKFTEVPTEYYDDAHLQMRHPQHVQRTAGLKSNYEGYIRAKYPKASQYNLDIDWDTEVSYSMNYTVREEYLETVSKQNPDGTTSVTTETRSRDVHRTETWTETFSRQGPKRYETAANYEEILNQQATPDAGSFPLPSAKMLGNQTTPSLIGNVISRGPVLTTSARNVNPRVVWMDTAKLGQIFEWAKDVIKKENPMRELLSSWKSTLDDLTNDTYVSRVLGNKSATETLMGTYQKGLDALHAQQQEAAKYLAMTDEEIVAFWGKEIPEQFRARNQIILNRTTQLIERTRLVMEQIKRAQPSLEVTYTLPDYSAPMAILEESYQRNRTQKIIAGATTATATVGGIGAGVYAHDQGYLEEEFLHQKWEEIKSKLPSFGSEDESFNEIPGDTPGPILP